MSDSSSEEEEFTFSPEKGTTTAAAASASNNGDSAKPEEAFMKQAIPKKKKKGKKKKKDKKKKKKKKRKEEKKKEKHDDESGNDSEHVDVEDEKHCEEEEDDSSSAAPENDDSNNDENEEMQVSLNDLKRKVMGRDLKTEEDSDQEQDAELQQIKRLMNAEPAQEDDDDKRAASHNTKSMAEKLRRDLMCSICHEVVYPPVSLLCGHSFCQSCLEWWFDRSRADPSCPTCRKTVPVDRRDALSHNFSLKACVMAVYGAEIVERLKARRTKGERGGRHDQGYEVLSILEDETWHYIKIKTDKGVVGASPGDTVQVRRSINLDAEDQRMQLALSVYRRPQRIVVDEQNAFRVQLCLLHMEEDEAADSGFPSSVENEEDEMLLCGRESRILHTYIEVKMKAENGRTSLISRIASDDNGLFNYTLDPSIAIGDASEIRGLLFEHADSGCRLEIDLAQLQSRGGSTLRPQNQPNRGARSHSSDEEGDSDNSYNNGQRRRGFVVGDGDESDEGDENQDEFEDDGFLVDDQNQTSDIDGEFSGEEEDNDICEICKKHGDLMICDGGKEDDGCGKSFHAACVNRDFVPEGEWICQNCASSHGIATGIEGHEFKAKQMFASGGGGGPKALDDDSDDDSDAEFTAKQEPGGNGPAKKKRRVLEDSDSE